MKSDEIPAIVIDSREQLPYCFDGHPVEQKALRTGDYSIIGCENLFAVERKSVNDLVSTVTHGRDRFERELARSNGLKRLYLIIESNLQAIVNGDYRSKANPASIIGSLLAWEQRYPALRVMYCDNRQLAGRMVKSLLFRCFLEFSSERA